MRNIHTFARIMRELGYGIHAAPQIGGKHLQAFTQRRTFEGISARTLAKELSHLRAVLKHVDKRGLAANASYSNRALGIGRGSRLGTKQPLSDEALLAFQQRMDLLGRPNIGALLELQRSLGLREAEAIRGAEVHTLDRWRCELQQFGSARVISGTKGGRPRDVHPAQIERALTAVQHAQTLLEVSGQRYLLTRADGSVTTVLKQAIGVYRNICYRAGVQSHSAATRSRLSACRRTATKDLASARPALRHLWTSGMAMVAGVMSRAFMRAASEMSASG